MNHVTALVRTPTVSVERFAHVPDVPHADPDVERADGFAINIVEAGSFKLRTRNRWQTLGARQAFVTQPGLEFSCRHDCDFPIDRCLSLRFAPEAIESLWREGARPPAAAVTSTTNRVGYLLWQLGRTDAADAAGVEAIAGAVYWSLHPTGAAPRPLFRAHQLSWYASRIARTRALMDAHFSRPLSLSLLAGDAGMSIYHFARVFRELEGQTPHQWLVARRLTEARRLLMAGAPVTQVCFDVGFGSLSHFTTSYRRHFNERPSSTRRLNRPLSPLLDPHEIPERAANSQAIVAGTTRRA